MSDILPWQDRQWQQVIATQQQNRLPHALLLTGAPGLGKKHFALALAHTLLCNKPSAPCGECHACHLVRAQSHPDFLLVEPEQAGHIIKIDQIREVVQFVTETASQNGLRIIIIHPANAMNINAANALLKTLEEPAPNSFIILISDRGARLPATITSRCQKIIFQKPTPAMALEWLQKNSVLPGIAEFSRPGLSLSEKDVLKLLLNLAEGAPFKAKELAENGVLALRQTLYQGLELLAQRQADPLQLAAQNQEQDILVVLHFILIWLQDLLRCQLTQGQAELINFDYQPVLAKLAQLFARDKLLTYIDQVKKSYIQVSNSLNLNRQLLLEELFIRWAQYATR